jgi:hypothetical protein
MSEEQRPAAEPEAKAPVPQIHGGALMRGGDPRPANPTPAHVSSLATKRLYQVIPKLSRIAMNVPGRSKRGKNKGKRTGKAPHSTANQIRAIAELRMLAYEDRVPMAALTEALMGMTDDIRGFRALSPEAAEALIALIAPRFIGLRR